MKLVSKQSARSYVTGIALVLLFLIGEVSFGLDASNGCYNPQTSEGITFATLKQDLIQNQITTTEDMLDYFSRTPKYSEFITDPVFLKRSEALHGEDVSPSTPRVNSTSGNLSMHVVADPTKLAHFLIEFTEFHPLTGKTTFPVIDFSQGDTKHRFIDDALHLSHDIEKIHEKNVGQFTSCSYCHNGKPFWRFPTSVNKPFGAPYDRIQKGTKEYEDYQKFRLTLQDITKGALYRKFRFQEVTDSKGNIHFPRKPSQRFSDHAHRADIWNLARPILSMPRMSQYQYSILGILFECDNFSGFFEHTYSDGGGIYFHDYFINNVKKSLTYPWGACGGAIRADLIPDEMVLDPFRFVLSEYRRSSKSINESQLIDMVEITPSLTTEKVVNVLELGVKSANLDVLNQIKKEVPNEHFADISEREKEFTSTQYTKMVAKLRLVLESRLRRDESEVQREFVDRLGVASVDSDIYEDWVQAFRFPRFVHWFPSEEEFPRHNGYRIVGGTEGLRKIAACYLGERFLKENPDLNDFRTAFVHPDNLKTSRRAFCEKLRLKSGAALNFLRRP